MLARKLCSEDNLLTIVFFERKSDLIIAFIVCSRLSSTAHTGVPKNNILCFDSFIVPQVFGNMCTLSLQNCLKTAKLFK